MTTDIILTLLNVTFGIVLIGIGVEMVNNPPGAIRWKKNLYRALFVIFGSAVIAVTGIQAVRSANEQQKSSAAIHADQLTNQGKLSYMQGTLDAVRNFETQFIISRGQPPGNNDSKDAATIAAAIIRAIPPQVTAGKTEISSPLREKLNQLSIMVYEFAAERAPVESKTFANQPNSPSQQSMIEHWKESVKESGQTQALFTQRLLPQINQAIQEAVVNLKVSEHVFNPTVREKYPGLTEASFSCEHVTYSGIAQDCASALQRLATEVH